MGWQPLRSWKKSTKKAFVLFAPGIDVLIRLFRIFGVPKILGLVLRLRRTVIVAWRGDLIRTRGIRRKTDIRIGVGAKSRRKISQERSWCTGRRFRPRLKRGQLAIQKPLYEVGEVTDEVLWGFARIKALQENRWETSVVFLSDGSQIWISLEKREFLKESLVNSTYMNNLSLKEII